MTTIACGRRVRRMVGPMGAEMFLAERFREAPSWVPFDLVFAAEDEGIDPEDLLDAADRLGVVSGYDERGYGFWRLPQRRFPRLPRPIRKLLAIMRRGWLS